MIISIQISTYNKLHNQYSGTVAKEAYTVEEAIDIVEQILARNADPRYKFERHSIDSIIMYIDDQNFNRKGYCVYSNAEWRYDDFGNIDDIDCISCHIKAEHIRKGIPMYYAPVIHSDGTYGEYDTSRGFIRWEDGHMDTLAADIVGEYRQNYINTL